MSDATAGVRSGGGGWRPPGAIALAPINTWPPRPAATARWLFGFPGYLWPYNAFWLLVSVVTWAYLTPELDAMAQLELGWIGWLLARNLLFVAVLYGALHYYLHVRRGQGDELRFSARPFAEDSPRFKFRSQVRDNVFHTVVYGVPTITAYEAITYWAFANGYLGYPGLDLAASPVLFWGWFAVLVLLAPVIHALHFYFAHRLLHARFMFRRFHALHHRNIDVGPWSGLSMHPVEHALYFSTIVVQWVLALHPVNALLQLHLAAFYPALGHSGFEKLRLGAGCDLDGGSYFHDLHHKHFECNYGGSLVPLDQVFGTFHDGTDEAHARMRARIEARRRANA
ncbi:MAG: sterol desaturase family protein [Ectothiorhodospiraceae bacterium]|nr:sterol desaturase family protein [Chromatiales bacterium]MCP5153605.1 sterol desaturase family protein [Ectothiorhodospiraceae bacterium]